MSQFEQILQSNPAVYKRLQYLRMVKDAIGNALQIVWLDPEQWGNRTGVGMHRRQPMRYELDECLVSAARDGYETLYIYY